MNWSTKVGKALCDQLALSWGLHAACCDPGSVLDTSATSGGPGHLEALEVAQHFGRNGKTDDPP